MKQRQKCCSHCPGKIAASFDLEDHSCPLPTYISGNLRLSSLKNYVPGEEERAERLSGKTVKSTAERLDSCMNRFAIAKKFHAENLQHQPLPDKVDDSIFTNVRPTKLMENLCSKCKAIERCQRIIPQFKRDEAKRLGKKFGPVLGCKKPETHMDLAICWETPVNPEYEPRRALHIDGTDGGPAPAVFTLVQHSLTSSEKIGQQCQGCNRELKKGERYAVDELFPSEPVDRSSPNELGNNCDLCTNFDSIHISGGDEKNIYSKNTGFRPRVKHATQLRHCLACDALGKPSGNTYQSRYIQSAKHHRNSRRNGMSNKYPVPRPRTPFARRSFCIDTLAPPFSIVQGCRDADYPEHWRLTSVYQQSYRNPKKQRGTILNYDH
ncbi:uncharacterized protein LOC122508603 [Leptopilina heterotoma]|uniref:uncharacterized protein LOC122508603 n=1 Tax=Leptopilina heterotoma TaxID=63436 RepID=UPI001CA9E41D|nr:uncharacterized protein LOC122508603 [Leptopilina heterotoma]XP_043477988.1 uncharacterized protein LOC122508603 [Leptopilina heterotoma]